MCYRDQHAACMLTCNRNFLQTWTAYT